jgi:DNA-binding MarR family transcriptional regulator
MEAMAATESMSTDSTAEPGWRPDQELDPVIHAQARLRVMVALSVLKEGDRLAFPRLQETLGMTAGNLSVHLRKLEEAEYIEVTKTHQGRTPTTLLSLTQRGRLALHEYTAAVKALLAPTDER